MSIFEIILHVIVIGITVVKVIDRPLFNGNGGWGGDFKFDWVSFLWFSLGFATGVHLVYSLL